MIEQLLYSHGLEAYVDEDENSRCLRKVLGKGFGFEQADHWKS